MEKIRRLRDEYREYIDTHRDEMTEATREMRDDIEHSALNFRDEINGKPLAIPRLFSMEMKKQFDELTETTCGILKKVIKEYLEHEDYRRLFPFSKETEELILLSDDPVSLLPLARFDIFYHEDTGEFKFCEINADGSSGMNADRIMADMMIHNPAHQEMMYRYDMHNMELFDTWVDTFLSMYEEYRKRDTCLSKSKGSAEPVEADKAVKAPGSATSNGLCSTFNVAIVDFLDIGRVREFEEFVRRFQKRGANCEICDIRDLKYENGVLYSAKGHRVDAIYRRAVTTEIIDRLGEVEDFIRAVKERSVFLAGEFCTHVIDNKWTCYVLHHERTARFLTEKEREFIKNHIPGTFPFNEKGIDKAVVLGNKDDYILKPWDGYAAHGVKAGLECSQAEWEAFVSEVYGTDYICQEFAKQYNSYNIDFMFNEGKWMDYSHMTGLFVYNGRFSGVIARSAPAGGIIDYYRDERRQPTFFVE